MTLERPPDGSTHWSVRRLAAATGLSVTTVHRIWRDHKLRPHQVRSFKFSRDPKLVEKAIDVVGLRLAPPKGALVLCVDEKTQIQALDRTQPTLPMKPGKAARMTHDYQRNGTTSLYAALEIASGEIAGACYPQHRHQEFLAIGIYLAVVTLTTRALPLSSPVGVAASTLAAAALFNPLRRRIQRVVDRRFNRARYNAEATIATFTTHRDAIDLDTVPNELMHAVDRSVQPSHTSLWIRPPSSRARS